MRVQDAFMIASGEENPQSAITPRTDGGSSSADASRTVVAPWKPAKKQRDDPGAVHGRVLRPCYDVPALMNIRKLIYALRLAVRTFVNGEQIIE